MKIPILILDTVTKNNRIYPRAVMEKAIAKYKKEFIDEDRAFIQKQLPGDSCINLKDCVGVVKEIKIEDNTVFVEAEFFPKVPGGLITEEGLKSGKLSLRTHGMGSIRLQPDGTFKIGDDYELISTFATDDPGSPRMDCPTKSLGTLEPLVRYLTARRWSHSSFTVH
jgi:hypothetical protein